MSSVTLIDEDTNELFFWTDNILNTEWNEQAALNKLLEAKETLVCDALLDPNIFPGVGNIIKNEVLYSTCIHPLSKIGGLKRFKLLQLIRETRNYALQYMNWKNQGIMHVQWKVHQQELCPKHETPLKVKVLGKTMRKTYYCEKCQTLYI
jgi:endonuclease-8